MCLQALKLSQNILEKTLTNKYEPIDSEFKKLIDVYLSDEKNQLEFEVDHEITKKSITLMQYFISQKKILAGYTKNYRNFKSANKRILDKKYKIMRKILLEHGRCIKSKQLNKNGQRNEAIIDAMKELTVKKLGVYKKQIPPNGGHANHIFKKELYTDLNEVEKQVFRNNLSSLNITIDKYGSSFP